MKLVNWNSLIFKVLGKATSNVWVDVPKLINMNYLYYLKRKIKIFLENNIRFPVHTFYM